jgi:hypothetical protein
MQTKAATKKKKKRSQKKASLPLHERAAFSPSEFATLFGKQTTWGYRQLYSGKVKAIQTLGRTLIPRSELERLLQTATAFVGKKTNRAVA